MRVRPEASPRLEPAAAPTPAAPSSPETRSPPVTRRPAAAPSAIAPTAAPTTEGAPSAPASQLPAPAQATEAPERGSFMAAVFGGLPRVACAAVVAVTAGCAAPIGPGASLDAPEARQVEGVPVTLAPPRASPEAKHDHYHRLVAAAGGRYQPGEVHVLALRGLDSRGRRHDARAQAGMRDTIVVLRPGPEGRPVAFELAGSTYPGARTGRDQGPDVTGDGRGDVGMVREGNFRTVPNGEFFGGPSYWVLRHGGGDGLPGVRDTNQDGVYSEAEYAASARRGDRLHEVLFHMPTRFTSGETAVNSIGCWNVRDYDRFVELLGGPSARFDVTLLDAYAQR